MYSTTIVNTYTHTHTHTHTHNTQTHTRTPKRTEIRMDERKTDRRTDGATEILHNPNETDCFYPTSDLLLLSQNRPPASIPTPPPLFHPRCAPIPPHTLCHPSHHRSGPIPPQILCYPTIDPVLSQHRSPAIPPSHRSCPGILVGFH